MTKSYYADLPTATRRRLLLRTVLRPVLTTTALVLLYYLLPLADEKASPTALTFAIALVLVGVLLGVQVRQISNAEHPRLQAIEALSLSVPLFILIFAAVYYEIARGSPGSFTEELSRTDSLYFTITTFATVGFGDITPVSQTARILVMIQMFVDLILVGIIAHAIVGAVRTGLRRKQPEERADQQRAPR